MKILFNTSDAFPPTRPDVAVLFGRYAFEQGLTTDLFAQRADKGAAYETSWDGGRAFVYARRFSGPLNQIYRFLSGFRIFFTSLTGYDALQVRDRPLMALIWLIAARLKKRPFFYWMSYPDDVGSWMTAGKSKGLKKFYYAAKGGFLYLILRFWVFPYADHLFVQSERLRKDIHRRYGIPLEQMTAVPMGVDMDSMKALMESPAVGRPFLGQALLVYSGAMDPVRELEILIDVLKILHQTSYRVALLMVGDSRIPGALKRLQDYADKQGVSDSVFWTGWLPLEAAWRWTRSADIGLSMIPPVFAFSSPTKTIEYMAAGLPVVASVEIDDQRVVVQESQAGIAIPFDATACADAIQSLLDRPDLLSQMAERGPVYARQHRSYPVLAKKLIQTYRMLLLGN